jgi:hypothetical protein
MEMEYLPARWSSMSSISRAECIAAIDVQQVSSSTSARARALAISRSQLQISFGEWLLAFTAPFLDIDIVLQTG